MKKFLRYILIFALMVVVFVPTLLLLTACDETFEVDGIYYTLRGSYAEVNYFVGDGGGMVCEIPSEVEYEGSIYPVMSVKPYQPFMSPQYDFVEYGYAIEIILPATIAEFHYLEYEDNSWDSQFKYLEKITVHPDNLIYSSVDGVLFDAAGSEMLWYPEGKQDETFTIPENMLSISPTSKFWKNKYIQRLEVDKGNVYYKSEDNVLFSADGSELVYRVPNDENYYVIPSTVSVVCYGALPSLVYLYVPKSVTLFVDSFVEAKQSVTNIRYIYFEADTLPNYMTAKDFYGVLYFGKTVEEFNEAVAL